MPHLETLREERTLTPVAFNRLLEWLDDGDDSGGATYLEIRRRLVWYFDRRNRLTPEDLADETLNRIARTLEESGSIGIRPPARYCYVVARFVLLEDLRRKEHTHVRLDAPRVTEPSSGAGLGTQTDESDEDRRLNERRLECLEGCLQKLKPEQRELIVEYYRDAARGRIERRRALADRLGISMNALAVRACRIRDTLEACVGACFKER